jgi:uncharacterized protein (TIGR03435 family)
MRKIGTAAVVFAWTAALGQSTDSPAFEVASVKPAAAQEPGRGSVNSVRGGPGSSDPGQVRYTNISLMNVLVRAYDVKPWQISGPAWLDMDRYDIAATVPPGATKEQFNLMLRNLLTERFHLALHHESKEVQGFELTPGKRGPKLKESAEVESKAPTPAAPPAFGPGIPPKIDANGFPQLDRPGMVMRMVMGPKGATAHLTARAQPVSALIQALSGQLRKPVIDKTGLAGKYDFTLEFEPEGMPLGPGGALAPGVVDATDESGPNIVTAVQEQLGLKLESKRIQLDMLIIDRADKVPTEN